MLLIFNSILHGTNYPNVVKPQVGSSLLHTLEVIMTSNDAPVGFSRLKYNKKSLGFTLKYDNILKDEFEVLKNFFENNQGTKFKFIHTDVLGSTEYWVMFAMDELKVVYGRGNIRSTTIQLVTT